MSENNKKPLEQALTDNKGNILLLELKNGEVLIEMFPEIAPKHVKRIKELVGKGYYDGHKFHRVIEGFMAQTGDPSGTGMGGSGENIEAEFSDEEFLRGTVGMARSMDVDSADSQWFICFATASHLNGQYTVWGKVISGIEFVDSIKKGDAERNGLVENPDEIVSLRLY